MIRFLFALILLSSVACGTPPERTELLPGEIRLDTPVPDFSVETLAGDTLSSSDLKGQITIINFWATWCGPCVVEIPELVALQEDWSDRPFQMIGVSMDEGGFDTIRPFVDDFHINYPQIMDPGPLGESFGGVYALPSTFVVNQDGIITSRYLGLFPLHDIQHELDAMVKAIEDGNS